MPGSPSDLLNLNVAEAIFVLILGLFYLFYGWQVFRVMITATGVLVGAGVGLYLSSLVGVRPYILAPLTGITGGLVAVPMQRATVFLLAGLCGGGLGLWVAYMGTGDVSSLAVILSALAGFLLFGILAGLFLRPVVVAVSVLVGAAGCSWAVASISERVAPGAVGPYWRGVPLMAIGLTLVLIVLGIACHMFATPPTETRLTEKRRR